MVISKEYITLFRSLILPGSLGESGILSKVLPPSVVCKRIEGFPTIHPSLSDNDAISNR